MSASARSWYARIVALVAVAVAVHLTALWVLPRLIMGRVMSAAAPAPQASNRVVLPPPTDHLQRRVVMPSPDLLYALCTFDVSTQPMRIRADPKTPHYWSIALYAANSDNFFVINDRQAAGLPVDIVLNGPSPYPTRSSSPSQPASAQPTGAQTVQAPSTQGLLLMRVLVTDYTRERDIVEAARRSLQCEPLTGAS
ncbi:MAG: DUF1254 domain-containing protein [Burkholderiales bacterium]|nr:DUF1254 domain-containing protein [Burkholderiales bacterium]